MPQRQEDIKFHKEQFLPLTQKEEAVGKAIVNAAYIVHKALGPALETVNPVWEAQLLSHLKLTENDLDILLTLMSH